VTAYALAFASLLLFGGRLDFSPIVTGVAFLPIVALFA